MNYIRNDISSDVDYDANDEWSGGETVVELRKSRKRKRGLSELLKDIKPYKSITLVAL